MLPLIKNCSIYITGMPPLNRWRQRRIPGLASYTGANDQEMDHDRK